MRQKRSVINIVLVGLFSTLLFGCKKDPDVTSNPSEDIINTEQPSETTLEIESDVVTLDFYGLNDFHGSITQDDDNRETGWFKIASYLKEQERLNPGGIINVSAGDMWQGSADSNITRGKLLTELMNDANFAGMAIGNHEFDWKTDYISLNRELSNFPFLAANIFEKATGELASFVETSTIITRNGVKIGLIGTVGNGLESSIFYENVKDYEFRVPDNYIVEESKKLRKNGADIVTLLTHDSLVSNYNDYKETLNGTTNNGKPYVDLIFTGHAHTLDRQKINGVPILQTNGNGKQLMHVNLTFNRNENDITLNKYENIDYSNLIEYEDDEEALEIYSRYYEEEIREVKEEVVGTLTHGLPSRKNILNLANRVMYEAFKEEYPSLNIAVHNTKGVRVHYFDEGEVTYGDLYKAFPFDNEIRIIDNVSRTDANNITNYNAYYIGEEIRDNNTVVTIDYVSTKYPLYNYEQIQTGKYIRDIIADYFRLNGVVDGSQF